MTQNLPTKVWIYTDPRKAEGDPDRLQVFADEHTADTWFRDHDPEGVAFAYPVQTKPAALPA